MNGFLLRLEFSWLYHIEDPSLSDDFYQITLKSSLDKTKWKVDNARGKTYPNHQKQLLNAQMYGINIERAVSQSQVDQNDTKPSIQVQWQFTNCEAEQTWRISLGTLSCVPTKGFLITPENSGIILLSPPLESVPHKWVEVIVSLDTTKFSSAGNGIMTLSWKDSTNINIDQSNQSLILPNRTTEVDLHFFIPPNLVKKAPLHLSLYTESARSPIIIHQIVARIID